jgi:alcohol dehydrogenase (cytochrome c)
MLNRGVAILEDTLFLGTLDGCLLAIDAKNGRLAWKTQVVDYTKAYTLVHAPLVVKDKVLTGPAGGEFGIRGFIAAFDAKSGKEVWRFNTVAGPGEAGHETWGGDSWKTGGAPIWLTGSYDPELNLTYWGTGNPAPSFNKEMRPGDNLYSSSVVALDADTGKLRWHYQFTPQDEWDWDAVQIPVLADMDWQGRPRKLMLWANRNGFYYVLDRASGQFLQAKAFVKQTWNAGFDEKGRPVRSANCCPTREGNLIFPGQQGATNCYNPSYSPRTGMFYIPTWADYYARYNKVDAEYIAGRQFTGGSPRSDIGVSSVDTRLIDIRVAGGYGAVRALDVKTGNLKWEFKMGDVTDGGILTTAADLLFTGNRDQYFYALDARTGALLWKIYLGGNIRSGPITYFAGGKQHIAVAAGSSLLSPIILYSGGPCRG